MSRILRGAGAFVALLVVAAVTAAIAATAAQDVRPDSASQSPSSSQAIQTLPGTSSELTAVLIRSCGDCHSNAMASGWYTRVPLFSTMMKRGASKGRAAVNFSEWSRYAPEQQRAILLASCADAKRGTMPMKPYLRFRGDARLSAHDIELICAAAPQVEAATTTSAPRR